MNTTQPFIIFSVFSADETGETNAYRQAAVKEFLDAEEVKHIEVTGAWHGVLERSFLVPDNKRSRSIAENAATSYNQESILLVDANRRAVLVYRDGGREEIGTWGVARSGESPDCYTEYNGTRYVCR